MSEKRGDSLDDSIKTQDAEHMTVDDLFQQFMDIREDLRESALGLRWCDCDFDEDIIHATHALLYKRGEDCSYRYRVSAPKRKRVSVRSRFLYHSSEKIR